MCSLILLFVQAIFAQLTVIKLFHCFALSSSVSHDLTISQTHGGRCNTAEVLAAKGGSV